MNDEEKRLRRLQATKEWRMRNAEQQKAYNKKYREENKEMRKKQKKAWDEKNKEHVKVERKKYYKDHPFYHRNRALKHQYGLTIEDYEYLLEKQNYCCAVCGKHESDTGRGILFIDHCHSTHRVRGLLCQHCNTALGMVKDNIETLESLILYLQISRKEAEMDSNERITMAQMAGKNE